MAADCSSVKPSLCSLRTNLSVSKWWSRCGDAVAWNARRSAGPRAETEHGLGGGRALKGETDDCEPGAPANAAAAQGRAGPGREPQLSRGSRNRGRASATLRDAMRGVGAIYDCEAVRGRGGVLVMDPKERSLGYPLRVSFEVAEMISSLEQRPAVKGGFGRSVSFYVSRLRALELRVPHDDCVPSTSPTRGPLVSVTSSSSASPPWPTIRCPAESLPNMASAAAHGLRVPPEPARVSTGTSAGIRASGQPSFDPSVGGVAVRWIAPPRIPGAEDDGEDCAWPLDA